MNTFINIFDEQVSKCEDCGMEFSGVVDECPNCDVNCSAGAEQEDDCCVICGGPLLAPYGGGFTGRICEGCDD